MADTPICHICKEIMSRKKFFSPTSLEVEQCLLCNRPFCVRHKEKKETKGVCEINHERYYLNHRDNQSKGKIFRNMEHRNIEMDPSNAELGIIEKVLMEREEIKKKREEEKRIIKEATKGEGEGTSEAIAKREKNLQAEEYY
ncbi:hypothetical protein BOTCAL_0050g00120 [Botryotinia calthae]|uniref:Uncharacterized protein n=1 Tax=Botryotinia calthae TaxID=38488 RepID=A0A4Y8DAZ6_9HELO|nr:hypothetical protein BOTCAL_0050g00120 [Botryotinia calthae]